MTTRAKALWLNILFHFGMLGFIIRPLFYPNMPDEYWLALLLMMFLMNPIMVYFFNWEMNLRGHIPADAPKYQRLIAVVILIAVYTLMFLLWLGVVEPISKDNASMGLGHLYSIVV